MTISTLHGTIQHLASQFAAGVLDAIRGASLEEILSETGGHGAGRRAGRPSAPLAFTGGASGGRRKGGRLARRSPHDIAKVVESIVSLLSGKPDGLRAEQIRAELNLEAKELPRPISEALASHKISKRGQKRATTYFAKAGKGASSRAGRSPRRSSGKAAKRTKPARGGKRSSKKPAAAHMTQTNGAPAAS